MVGLFRLSSIACGAENRVEIGAEEELMSLYPLNLRIDGRLCVVIGGGEVAARKTRSLLSCGARVRVISPVVVAEIARLAAMAKITWEQRPYCHGDLVGVLLAFAATDTPTVQAEIIREARARGVLLNSADDQTGSDFHVPATVRRGELLMTVSTGGASPALSAAIRKRLEGEYGQEYLGIVELFRRIRQRVVPDGESQAEHQLLFQSLLRLNIVDHARTGNWSQVATILSEVLPAGFEIPALLQGLAEAGH